MDQMEMNYGLKFMMIIKNSEIRCFQKVIRNISPSLNSKTIYSYQLNLPMDSNIFTLLFYEIICKI